MGETTPRQLLQYAADKVGKPEAAKRLKVAEETLSDWLRGTKEMPNSKLGALADLIDSVGR